MSHKIWPKGKWAAQSTEKTENGLYELIISENGTWIGWAYNKETAELLASSKSLYESLDRVVCLLESYIYEAECQRGRGRSLGQLEDDKELEEDFIEARLLLKQVGGEK